MSVSKRLRAERTDCPVVGKPQPMKNDQLPLVSDILRAYLYANCDPYSTVSAKQPPWKSTREMLCSQVEDIWKRASIPIVSTRRIHQMLDKWKDKFRNILRPYKQRQSEISYNNRLVAFRDECLKLFDVASCKCLAAVCHYPADQKVPERERCFLHDQRNDRKMYIGREDKKVSRDLFKRFKRKEISQQHQQPNTSFASVELEYSDEDVDESNNVSDPPFDVSLASKYRLQPKKQSWKKYLQQQRPASEVVYLTEQRRLCAAQYYMTSVLLRKRILPKL